MSSPSLLRPRMSALPARALEFGALLSISSCLRFSTAYRGFGKAPAAVSTLPARAGAAPASASWQGGIPDVSVTTAVRRPSRRNYRAEERRVCHFSILPNGTTSSGAFPARLPLPGGGVSGIRLFNTYTAAPRSSLGTAILFLVGTIAAAGAAGTAWWYWNTPELRKYPKSVQRKLRLGMRAREIQHDLTAAITEFQSALDELLSDPSPPAELARDSRHVIGVMDQLAHTFVLKGLLHDAEEVYRKAFAFLIDTAELDPRTELGPAPPAEKFSRALGIAQRLGDLCQQTGDVDEAEQYLVWSVRRMLGDPDVVRQNEWRAQQEGHDFDFVYPEWTTPADVGACLETLATFYARERGRYDLAIPIYLRVLSLLDTKADPCQTALLLNNVAEGMAGLARFEDARAWVAKGLELVEGRGDRNCVETYSVLLFNDGMVRELANDLSGAEQCYKNARAFAEKHDLSETAIQADNALRRIQSG